MTNCYGQLCKSHVLDARNATFAQWVAHQGNYLMEQLTYDVSKALSPEEQYERYLEYRRLRRRPGTDGKQSQAALGEPTADPLVEEKEVLRYRPNMLWLLRGPGGG